MGRSKSKLHINSQNEINSDEVNLKIWKGTLKTSEEKLVQFVLPRCSLEHGYAPGYQVLKEN